MGQQKNTQLKAYVRFDGTGRIIPSSLILQRSKPKVGNWQEIDATECCGYVPSTTTTTTTVAPTQFSRGYWLNETDACSTTTAGISVFYSASSTFTSGISIFQDAQLTIPVTQGYVISSGMSRFLVGANGVITTFVCP